MGGLANKGFTLDDAFRYGKDVTDEDKGRPDNQKFLQKRTSCKKGSMPPREIPTEKRFNQGADLKGKWASENEERSRRKNGKGFLKNPTPKIRRLASKKQESPR